MGQALAVKRPYGNLVYKHLMKPVGSGSFSAKQSNVFSATVGEPHAGGTVRLQVLIDPNNEVIKDARFMAHGCGVLIATASWVVQSIKGLNLKQAQELNAATICAELNLPPVKMYCAILLQEAVSLAVKNYQLQE